MKLFFFFFPERKFAVDTKFERRWKRRFHSIQVERRCEIVMYSSSIRGFRLSKSQHELFDVFSAIIYKNVDDDRLTFVIFDIFTPLIVIVKLFHVVFFFP